MTTVGLRHLKTHLSDYVRRARRGTEVLVTDRGTVVARLVPPAPGTTAADPRAVLEEMARRGELILGVRGGRGAPARPPRMKPAAKAGLAERLLDEDRAEGRS